MTSLTPETGLPPDHLLRQLIDAITAHPEVREPLLRVLLTEDFLTLPNRVDKLQGEFEEFREETRAEFRTVNERLDANTAELRTVNERLDANTAELRTVNERLDANTAEIRTVNERLDANTAEIRTINERLDANSAELRAVNERLDAHGAEFRAFDERLDANTRAVRMLEGHVGRLIGRTYEDRCRYEIGVILDGWLSSPILADRSRISEQLLQARHEGIISREQYMDGLRPDIIAREIGDTDQTGRLAVVEVSVTFNRGDLENAARRAAVISSVTGANTVAFVATHAHWPDEVDSLAQQLGVTIIRHEDPDYIDA